MNKFLFVIEETPIFSINDGKCVTFTAPAMVDGDGSGSSHGDPDFQPNTTYQPALNADQDRYIAVPPQIRSAVAGVVMGCRVLVVNLKTMLYAEALVGDIGPSNKIGELSIACANALGIASSPTTGGESDHVISYFIWPNVAANVNGRLYTLQHA